MFRPLDAFPVSYRIDDLSEITFQRLVHFLRSAHAVFSIKVL
jgi:hypothetical protein